MRLEKKGCITSTYREPEMGPHRKYYRITETGKAEIDAFSDEFARLSTVVAHVLGKVAEGYPEQAEGVGGEI